VRQALNSGGRKKGESSFAISAARPAYSRGIGFAEHGGEDLLRKGRKGEWEDLSLPQTVAVSLSIMLRRGIFPGGGVTRNRRGKGGGKERKGEKRKSPALFYNNLSNTLQYL